MKLEQIKGSQNDGLFRDPATQIIYFRKYREGKGEIYRSTKTRDLGRARIKREQFMVEIWGDTPLKIRRSTAGEHWPAWKQGMIETKAKNTIASITASEKHLLPHIMNKFLDELTPEWWTNQYIPKKREETTPDRKFFNDRKWLSMFLKWCEENGKADKGWRRPKLMDPDPETDVGKAYTIEETDALIQAADWMLLPKIIMALEHFMRRSEIAFLSWDRVDRKNRVIHLRAQDTKIRQSRSFPYNERLELLFQVIEDRHRSDGIVSPWVFPNLRDPGKSIGRDGFSTAWDGARRRSGVDGRFHDLRHTGLTRAFRKPGANPALICTFAGLSLEMAMKVYLHFQIDDLKAVLQ